MQGQRQHVVGTGRVQHGHAVPAAGVHGHLPRLPGAGGGQAGDEVGERVVGHREEHELGPRHDRGDVGQRHPRQQLGGPGPAGVAHGVRTGHPVAGPRERRPEHRTDPAGPDDPHGQPGGVLDAVHGQATYPSTAGSCSVGRPTRGRFEVIRCPLPPGHHLQRHDHGTGATVRRVMVPWREAWHEALYGPQGFYRGAEGPAGHFTTSTHGPLGAPFADALGRLADREGVHHVVDVGCGRGELLTHLAVQRPDLRLTGVDVVPRPPDLPDAVAWLRSPGGGDELPRELTDLDDVLVVAHEWLDVVPCTVAEVVGPGPARRGARRPAHR